MHVRTLTASNLPHRAGIQEEAMHTEAQRVRQEWDSARRVRAENEAGEAAWERRELEEKRRSAAVAAEEARHRQSMENDRKALDEERKIIAVAMEDLRRRELAIAPRERACSHAFSRLMCPSASEQYLGGWA